MTSPRRFEQDLPALLVDLYLAGTPDYRDDLFRQTARVRQRPAWTFPERWLPMDVVSRQVPTPAFPWRRVLALAVIGLLVVAAVAAYVGAQPHVPPPFGLAANGRVAFVTEDGGVAVADPRTEASTTIVPGGNDALSPVFSLDGTRIAFLSRDGDATTVQVVPASGGKPLEIARSEAAIPSGLVKWSPDGKRIAFVSGGDLWIAAADGSGARSIETGLSIDAELEWRPPDGRQLLVRGHRDGSAGLFLVSADGAKTEQVTPADGGIYDYLWLTFTPDGRRVAYSDYPARQVHILSIDDQVDTVVTPASGEPLMFPRWSPDGTRLAVMVWHADGSTQIGVLAPDERTPQVTLTGPAFPAGNNGIQHGWAPDGTSIIAGRWGTDQPWLLDPAGGPGTPMQARFAVPDWVEWQRLAPD